MALTKTEMRQRMADEFLMPKGWRRVGAMYSGVLEKNGFYFIAFPTKVDLQSRVEGDGITLVNIPKMIHSNSDYVVQKDGFVVAQGSFLRTNDDKVIALLEEIDRIAEEDFHQYYQRMCKEIPCLAEKRNKAVPQEGEKLEYVVKISTALKDWPDGIIAVMEDEKYPDLYILKELNETATGLGVGKKFGATKEQIKTLILSKALVQVRLEPDNDIYYNYESLGAPLTQLPQEFDDFNLLDSQKVLVSKAFAAGCNPTPLLRQNSQTLAQLVETGVDCSKLTGEESEGLLEVLAEGPGKDGLPIDLMLGRSVGQAKALYQALLTSYYDEFGNGDFLQKQRYFKTHDATVWEGIDKLNYLKNGYNDEVVEVLKKGIANNDFSFVSRSWVDMDEAEKNCVLRYFKCDGECAPGLSFTEALNKLQGKLLDLQYNGKYITLQGANRFWARDYNSVFEMNSVNEVLWRIICANGKYYRCCADCWSDDIWMH